MTIWLPDSSPIFSYSPSPTYFADSVFTAPWTGFVTDGSEAGLGNMNATYHSTNGPAAVIFPAPYATAYTPYWDNGGGYHVALVLENGTETDWNSGQTALLASYEESTVQLVVKCLTDGCSAPFLFFGAEVAIPVLSEAANATLDDSSYLVQYSGFTSFSTANISTGIVDIKSSDYNSSLSMTALAGSTAQITFSGSAILVTGVTCPACGPFNASIDGEVVANLDTFNNITAHAVPLFFVANLSTTETHVCILSVESGEEATGLVIDSFVVYGPSNSVGFVVEGSVTTIPISGSAGVVSAAEETQSVSVATAATGAGSPNIGTIIGAILGTLAGLGILFYATRKMVEVKKKVQPPKENAWDKANNLQNVENQGVLVSTVAGSDQRYYYPGGVAHSQLKK